MNLNSNLSKLKRLLLRKLLSYRSATTQTLQLLDQDRHSATQLYIYHKELDVIRYVPSLDRLYTNYKQGTATDSDHWMRELGKFMPEKCDIVFDIGVNFGHTSAWFSKRANTVYTFEPDANNQSIIGELLKIRNINNVELINTAVSDYEGETIFYIKEFSGLNSIENFNSENLEKEITVPVTTVDSFCEHHKIYSISLLKIDVEGFETEVLRGAEKMLKNKQIDCILFEFSPNLYKQRALQANEPIELLKRLNYSIYNLDGNEFDFNLHSGGQVDLVAKAIMAAD